MQDTEEVFSDNKSRAIPVEFFNQLRQRNRLLDVSIVTKEKCKIRAHRVLLSAQFPNIKDRLVYSRRRIMRWNRFSTDIVQSVIDFAYTGEIRISCNNVMRLYLLAHSLGSQALINSCCQFIISRLDQINLAQIWSISNLLVNKELILLCFPNVVRNFDFFFSNQMCLRYTRVESLKALLDSDRMWMISEEAKLKAIASWINAPSAFADCDSHDEYFITFLSTINVNKLSRSFVVETAMSESDIVLTDRSRRALLENWKNAEKIEDRGKREEIFVCGYDSANGSVITSASDLLSSEKPSYPLPDRKTFESIIALDGFIYIIGGRNKENKSSSRMYRINPLNGEVNIMKSMLFHRRSPSAAACGPDILVFGGYNSLNDSLLNSCEKFTPSSNMWMAIPDMPTARYGTGAVHVPGHGELVVGGSNGSKDLNTVELFQLGISLTQNDHAWRTLAPMLYPRSHPAIEFFKGSVYVAGTFLAKTQTAEMLRMCDDQPIQWTLVPHFESVDSRPCSMLKKGECLLVATEAGSIYKLEYSHGNDREIHYDYTWRFLIKATNLKHIKIVMI